MVILHKITKFIEKQKFIYLTLPLNIGMHCDTCGQILDSVDDSQVERYSKYVRPIYYCEVHKPLQFIVA